MINDDLSKNWGKFIAFNSKLDASDNPLEIEDKIRIPLTSIEIHPYLLYHLFEEIYPKFFNDQLNVLDLIVSDFDIDNIVLGAYLYQMDKPGIYKQIKEIKKNDLKLKFNDLNNKDLLLNQIQASISNNYHITITNFRIIKKRGLDLINRHMENLNKLSFSGFLESILNLIQTLITNDLIIFYPQPPILNFLHESLSMLKNVKLSQIIRYIFELFPPFNFSIILKSRISPILIDFSQNSQKSKSNDINPSIKWIKISKNEEIDLDKKRIELNRTFVIILHLDILINYFLDLFESSMPILQDKVKFLLQKFLFGIRYYQIYWNISPKPLIYNIFIRYLLRIVGFDLNLIKLSHWAIPEFLFSTFNSMAGLQGKLLFVFTDQDKRQFQQNKFLLVNFENGTFKTIEKVALEKELLLDNDTSSEDLRIKASEIYGAISLVIKVDKKLIQFILDGYIVNIFKLNLLKLFKFVRLLKNPNYFEISPPVPIYTLIKTKGIYTVIKNVLSILIDKHNF
jgi:hypothetical protein